MSNLTVEEILESLETGKGFQSNYSQYDREKGEWVEYGLFPLLKEELPEDAPDFVKEDAWDEFNIATFLGEELYSHYKDHKVEVVQNWGGEGEGDSAGVTIKIGDFYFQANWSYVSWDGFYYDDAHFYQVVPKEVMVTQYVLP